MEAKYITMDGVSLLGDYVLSFQSEKEFVKKHEDELFMHHNDLMKRRSLLKSVYKIAKKMQPCT